MPVMPEFVTFLIVFVPFLILAIGVGEGRR